MALVCIGVVIWFIWPVFHRFQYWMSCNFLTKNINSGHSVNSNISSFSKGLHTNISLQIWNYNLYILSIRKMQTSVNLVIKLTHTKREKGYPYWAYYSIEGTRDQGLGILIINSNLQCFILTIFSLGHGNHTCWASIAFLKKWTKYSYSLQVEFNCFHKLGYLIVIKLLILANFVPPLLLLFM